MSLINQMLKDLDARHAAEARKGLYREVRPLPPQPRRNRRGALLATAAVAAALLFAGGGWLAYERFAPAADAPPTVAALPAGGEASVSSAGGDASMPAATGGGAMPLAVEEVALLPATDDALPQVAGIPVPGAAAPAAAPGVGGALAAAESALPAPAATPAPAVPVAPALAVAPPPASVSEPPRAAIAPPPAPVSASASIPASTSAPTTKPAPAPAPVPAQAPTPTSALSPVGSASPAKSATPPASASAAKPAPASTVATAQAPATSAPAPAGPPAAPPPPAAKPVPAPPSAPAGGLVEKRAPEADLRARADADHRRAVGLVSSGRPAEAVDLLSGVLRRDAMHVPSRQLLARLFVDLGRRDDALALLVEGLAAQPGRVQWAMSAARLLVDRGDPAAAAGILEASRSYAAKNAEYLGFAGYLAHRLGRHEEAAGHYRQAIGSAPGEGRWWLGLGLALEAGQQAAEAREAFRRARATGTLNADLAALVNEKLR
jgi:MSHA biogenesis protein MshN